MPEGHFRIRRHMSVPVMDDGRIVAVAGVGNKEAAYGESDANQLSLFMSSMWSIIKQKRAQQILKKYSMEDGLTNRRRFDEVLGNAWQRALREQQPLSLIMLDMDYFKEFNDIYDHQAGDLVARYGGEEFVVVLPNTDLEGAREVADTMNRTVRDMNLAHKGSHGRDHLTISAGVACGIPSRVHDPVKVLEKADQALYRAKRAGRDCVKQDSGAFRLDEPAPAVQAAMQ
jgi:PleD family two-component response regulator